MAVTGIPRASSIVSTEMGWDEDGHNGCPCDATHWLGCGNEPSFSGLSSFDVMGCPDGTVSEDRCRSSTALSSATSCTAGNAPDELADITPIECSERDEPMMDKDLSEKEIASDVVLPGCCSGEVPGCLSGDAEGEPRG